MRDIRRGSDTNQSRREIVAMTSGGYGPLTITGPLTVIGTHGASITGSPSTTSITITAGASDKIVIRDVDFAGANNASSTGIQLNSGNLVLIDSKFYGLTTGLLVVNSHADVIQSDFVGNGTAIQTTGPGVDLGSNAPYTGTTTLVRINGGNYIGNSVAFKMNNVGNSVSSPSNSRLSIFCFSTGSALAHTAGNGTLTTLTGTPSGAPTYQACAATYSFGQDPN